jgi:hypothetical protein
MRRTRETSALWKFAVVAPLVLLPACAGSGSGPSRPQSDRNVITLAEIEETEARDAYEVVQQLRPRWMVRNRGQRTMFEDGADFAKVVVDEFPPREFDVLREIPRETIFEIRFLEPREATFLYGSGYNEGVVKVITKK